ncbi:MAG TPA: cellulose binding domain-containing protein [Actinoplanes sp.]|nr:cellulose binding domain-containing protein [Actinoplanes sp.]
MPGRHHHELSPDRSAATPGGRPWILALAVVAIVVGVAMIGGWMIGPGGQRADPQAIVVEPSAELSAPPAMVDISNPPVVLSSATSSTPATASASPTGSGTPSAPAPLIGTAPRAAGSTVSSPGARVSGTVTALAAPASASATPAPSAVPDELTAAYELTSTSADGFVAGVTVRNPTAAAQSWRVELTYPPGERITVTGYWNATPAANGRRLSFAGDPLTSGASYTFGFQARTDSSSVVNPTACTINGTACAGF